MHKARFSVFLLIALAMGSLSCNSKPASPTPARTASSQAALTTGWQETGSMSLTRRFPTATVLSSGKVLVVGGWDNGFLASAELYDPGSGTWLSTGAMPFGREGHTATLLPSGEVLVVGGEIQSAPGYTATALLYAPQTGLWTQVGSTSMARAYSTATLLPSGKVLVAGGGNNNGSYANVDVYDPTAGWSTLPSAMNDERRRHTATLLPSGKVLVVGGRGWRIFETVEAYDPNHPQSGWTPVASMATHRYDHTATLLPSGKLLVAGGRNETGPLNTSEVYDPTTNSWTAAQMATPRTLHTATLLPSGKVLIAGGEAATPLDTVELYDPETNTWSSSITLRTPRRLHAAVMLNALAKVLVLGGEHVVSGQTARLSTAELLGTCETVTCNTAPSQCHSSTGVCSNGGTCTYPLQPAGFSCNDGNACTGNDVCGSTGTCSGTSVACEAPPGQCYQSAGTCSDGSCSYAYKAAGAACDDGDACTLSETCNGSGGCAGTPVSCTTPPGQCYQAAGTCGGGACTYAPKAAGATCNDGNAGTLNDVCNGAGACAGVPACTTPPSACHDSPGTYANGACTYPVKAAGTACGAGQVCNAAGQCLSGCWIGGAYYAAGATNPSVACQECNPGVTTSGWSNKAVGSTCAAPTNGNWGSCGGFSDTCDETGSQSRTVTAYACTSSGTCGSSTGTESQACTRSTGGTACGTSYGGWGSCGGFDDSCDTTGTQSRTVTASTCGTGTCNASNTSTETQACTRAAPNTSCAAPSYGAWSVCSFSDVCAQTGTQSRTVTTSSYSCATGQCVASTSTETQSCTRNTNGNSCGAPSAGGWGTCSGYSSTCDETGTQSRSVTSYTCSNGTCGSSTGTESQTCTRNRDGVSCGTSSGGWGSCGGFSDYCDASGSQSRTVTDYECGGGSCNPSSSDTETQTCTRTPPGPQACPPSYGSWSACSGFSDACDATGTQSRQVTQYTYSCATGQCTPTSSSAETQTCTRTAPGPQPCQPTSYGPWGTCTRATPCGQGFQQRSVTTYSYSCASGACGATTTTETQDCSVPAIPGWTQCGNTCSILESDSNNCGACGNACTGPKYNVCMGGSCCYSPTNCL
ncbi:kelch repeat-containing protein [Corallococcus carmarthensis]|uniref:kelch repeat-containing protein n=1 Tax=Corallococcus carmarthensis TaxID=2316728 RepID=UPI00148DC75C|nr:kelch repeat-containing protein [Corallococcus carmarthensis]NOK21129.1 hypothetical protein [Corallococcus carmarthensis]